MQGKDALALLSFSDNDFLDAAGPAVLRLKLLEADHLAQSRRLPEDMREAARRAARELRALIAERPCTSLIDHAAKQAVAEAPSPANPTPPISMAVGHA
ncbi:hypothetical protein ACNHKD_18880 [Methylocystis sp. JAN1]|uniref:hypothetical protein n=1 Tax=Methylocystis sp. JAN1 TaxID=3397211 RepID=UPI003FA33146